MPAVGDRKEFDGRVATVVVADLDRYGQIVMTIAGGGYVVVDAADFDSRPDVDERIPAERAAWIVVAPHLDITAARLHRTEADAIAAASAGDLGVLRVPLDWRDAEPIR